VGGNFDGPEAEWTFSINYYGVRNMTDAFLPLLSKSQEARVVNVSSGLGNLGRWGLKSSLVERLYGAKTLKEADKLAEEFVVRVLSDLLTSSN
jgi:NAD(P)-dependent dehydrogenase (short-subunit alcohol dehydrogenase family)